MKLPLYFLGILLVITALQVVHATSRLPEVVVSHIGPGGVPDGWMNRATYLWAMVGSELAIMLPLVLVALTRGRAKDRSFNISHKEYWLAPERRADTVRYLQAHLLWLAAILQAGGMVLWQAGIDSNFDTAPLIPGSFVLKVVLVVVACIVWVVPLSRRFPAPPEHG